MLIRYPHLTTKLPIWAPRYSSAYSATGERVVLLAKYKVDQSTPAIIINFTKAKHLEGQRYAIWKATAQKYPLDTNGKIPCYAVPMSALEGWETPEERAELMDIIYD